MKHVGIVGPCSSGPLAEFLPDCGNVDVGWGGYSVVNLVQGLVRRGYRVSVITLSPNIDERVVLEGPQLAYYAYPTRAHRKTRDLYKLERHGLREGIMLAQPELLHAQWSYEFAWASLDSGLPTIVTARDNGCHILRMNKDLYRLGRLFLQVYVLRRAECVTAVSPYLAESLRWLSRRNIAVIPNFIEPRSQTVSWRQRTSRGMRIVTVLNGWGVRKNPKAAIRGFDILRKVIPEAELVMYGQDYEEGGIAHTWATKEKLSQNIRFRGSVPNGTLQQELEGAAILLHPALEESFGMVILEAMAQRLPVVAGLNTGGVPWVTDCGRAGFLTNVRSPEQIAATLLRCVQDSTLREEKVANAYDRVLNVFSPDAVIPLYEKLYNNVVIGRL